MATSDPPNGTPPTALPFLARLAQAGTIVGDGAMGTMLYNRGVPANYCFDECNLSQSKLVLDIHQAYIEAGAEIIETNTYGANRFKLSTYDLGEKVRAINFRGAKIAGNAREILGQPVLIAGAVGPLGRPLAPVGRIAPAEAQAIFREQIEGLLEGGVDLLMLETFKDLREMLIALRVAREVCDLPVVAQMSFEEEGRTLAGDTPRDVVQALEDAGADVIGANCSTGPVRMARVLAEMAAVARRPLSAQPNAGWPEVVSGRIVYVSGPTYMAEQARRMADMGVRLLGGCCGTTPDHIRELSRRLRAAETPESAAESTARALVDAVTERADLTPASPHSPANAEPPDTNGATQTLAPYNAREQATPGTFAWKLGREFVATIELEPPRGINPAKLLAGARMLHERGLSAVDITDSARGRASMSVMAVSNMVMQQVGLEVIIHFCTRDRSLLGLQAELLGAHAMGQRIILALTGDPPNPVEKIASSGVFDIDSIGLIKLLRKMNAGVDVAGNTIGGQTQFLIGCAFNPNARDLEMEIDRLHQKMEAGADFVMTQPFFDLEWLDKTLDLVGDFRLPILMGILPLQSGRHAEFLHNEVPGIVIPDWARKRMQDAGANGRQQGIAMAQELLLYAYKKVAGAYLMPSFGRYEVCAQVLDVVPEVKAR
ncbi:MAG TPA: bifunctional homocysteine S-methyltransferase/methylenetetrahydrofolate reductase [Chloroflexia bacterium]|nr:bifunctional homocysteine S-methyltransferase/methylenetetrahydrofolate reductase [Chloroflexia bacterium]